MNTLSPRLLLSALLLFTITAITYLPGLDNVFHFDDRVNITENSSIQIDQLSLSELSEVVSDAFLQRRLLPNLSFAVDWWRGDGDPSSFQFTNLCIHLFNTLLVFALLLMLFAKQSASTNQRLFAAFVGAAIWALHPIQLQSVSYIVQRMNAMASLFMLLSVLSYLYARLHARRPVGWYFLCLISFLCGAISKENAWITPLLLLLTEFAVCRRGQALIQSRSDWLVLSLPCLFGLYLLLDLGTQAGPYYEYLKPYYTLRDFSMSERLLTQPRVILFHFSQILWPLPDRFSIEHDFIKSTGLFTPLSTIWSLLAMVTLCVSGLIAVLKPRFRLMGFFILWIPFTLIIESSFIPLEMVFEHRLYLPMLGIVGLFGIALMTLSKRSSTSKRICQLSALVIISLLIISTSQRLPVWSSRLALVTHALEHAPNSARVWNNLGTFRIEEGQYEQALEAFDHAIQLDPAFARAYQNRGTYYLQKLASPKQAIADFNRALELQPGMLLAWLERGNAYAAEGDRQQAAEDYTTAIRLNPDFALAYNNRGLLALQTRDSVSALQDFEQSISLDPDYQPAYANRATALLTMRDYRGASEGFLEAIRRRPDDGAAHFNLGICLRALGEKTQASHYFQRACELNFQKGCLY